MNCFCVDVLGSFAPGFVQCQWRDEIAPHDAAMDEMIARTWQRQQARCQATGAMLFNGKMARYLRHHVSDGVLCLEVGPTDYASFLGTNFFNHARGDDLGWERFSNPVGTSALVISGDGRLVLGQRSEKVALHPGRIHPFGGSLEPREVRPDGTLDVFASITRELREELHLQRADLQSLFCLGIIHDTIIRQPELIFEARTPRTFDELCVQAAQDCDHEHSRLVACEDRPEAVADLIRDHSILTPVAVALLSVHRCQGIVS